MTKLFDDDASVDPSHRMPRDGIRRRRDDEPQSLWGLIKNTLAVATLTAVSFSAGMNWHRLDALTDRFDAHMAAEGKIHEAFANQQVVDEHFRSLQRQLEDLHDLMIQARDRRK